MVHVNEGTCIPRRLAKTQASKDRDAVNNIKMLLVGGLINPFTSSCSDLLNIATAEKCASLDLSETKEKGHEALSRAEELLNTNVTTVCLQTFHEKLQKPVKSLIAKIYQKETIIVRSLHFLRDIELDNQGDVTRKGIKADYVVAMKSQLGDSSVGEDH